MPRPEAVLTGLLCALLAPCAAHAADCAPPKLQNQIAMTAIATGDGSLVEALPVTLNGQQTQFLLDTGGIVSQISAALAAQLAIPINRTGDALVDVTGRQSAGLAMIRDFKLGSQSRRDVPLSVSPDPVVPTGLIALNDLTSYDAEMDFPAGTLKLYSQDHCPGVTSLPASTAPLPFTLRNGHITIAAMLDGKSVTAILDTGSTGTDLRADVAKAQFAVTPGSADTPQSGTLEGAASLPTYDHVFQSLAFGGITLPAPHVTILPDSNGVTAQSLGGPELIIGMNVLKTQHLYFAFGEGKLYVAAPPPPQSP